MAWMHEKPVYPICKSPAGLCHRADQFESYLVRNLEDGFSRDMAHTYIFQATNESSFVYRRDLDEHFAHCKIKTWALSSSTEVKGDM